MKEENERINEINERNNNENENNEIIIMKEIIMKM